MKVVPQIQLFFGIMITGILALSVHVFMSDVLHIPYPHNYPRTGWPAYYSYTLLTFTAIYLYQRIKNQFTHTPTLLKCLGLFMLLAMLNGDLIRGPLMISIVTSAWLLSFIQNLPQLFFYLFLACSVVLTASKLLHTWQQILAALLISLLLYFAKTVMQEHIGTILNLLPQPRQEDFIHEPYGFNVMLPSYLSFYESTLACFILVSLVWNQLSTVPIKRLGQFALLILLLGGTFLAPLIYIFYTDMPVITAMLSVGQFFLQDLVLALLTGLFWQRWHNRHQEPRHY